MHPINERGTPAVRVQPLSQSELTELDRALSSRARHLRVQIREDLQRRHSATAEAMVEQVRRLEDESSVDVDVSLAGLEREIQELRDIAAARLRVMRGKFGVCLDCGRDIGQARLSAYPTAKRCIDCQRAHEKTRSA